MKFSESKGCSGAVLHTLRPGSKGNSSSESYWPIHIYRGPHRLWIKASTSIFSFWWDRNILCITPSLYPQSLLLIRQVSHNTCLGEDSPTVWFPCPNIGKKAEHTRSVDKETYLYQSLKAKSHQWSYLNMKLAANKCLVPVLCCGKQILRDSTGVLTGGQCYQKVMNSQRYTHINIYIYILQKGSTWYFKGFFWGGSYTNFKRKKKNIILFRTDWQLSCSCSSPFSHSRNKNCFSNFRLPTSRIVPYHIKDLIHFPLAHFS